MEGYDAAGGGTEAAARAVLSMALEIAARHGELEDALLALIHSSPRDGAVLAEAIEMGVRLSGADVCGDRAVSLLRGARATGLFG